MQTRDLVKQIQDIVGFDGEVAFEHGFEYPTIKLKCGKTAKVTSITDDAVYGYYERIGMKHPIMKPLEDCTDYWLRKRIKSINDYIEFVKKTV